MIDTAEHIIRDFITTNQVFLEYGLIAKFVYLFQKEALVIMIVLFPTQASLEDTGDGHILDQIALNDHRLSLVLRISFLVTSDDVRFGAQSPKR